MPDYLDHDATPPMHPAVVDAMLPFLQNPTGNASSPQRYGLNLSGLVRPGKAAQVARLEMELNRHHLQQLRDFSKTGWLAFTGQRCREI